MDVDQNNELRQKADLTVRKFRTSDLFGSETYGLDVGDVQSGAGIVVLFVTDHRGTPIELGIQSRRGDVTLFGMNGSILEYNIQDEAPRVVQKDNAPRGVDCAALAAKATAYLGGGGNTQITTCLTAICKAANCKWNGQCGGSSQFELDSFMRIACMPAPERVHVGGGIYCVRCNE